MEEVLEDTKPTQPPKPRQNLFSSHSECDVFYIDRAWAQVQ